MQTNTALPAANNDGVDQKRNDGDLNIWSRMHLPSKSILENILWPLVDEADIIDCMRCNRASYGTMSAYTVRRALTVEEAASYRRPVSPHITNVLFGTTKPSLNRSLMTMCLPFKTSDIDHRSPLDSLLKYERLRAAVTQLTFGYSFNDVLDAHSLHLLSRLTKLTFGDSYNRVLTAGELSTLSRNDFGSNVNQQLEIGVFSSNLTH